MQPNTVVLGFPRNLQNQKDTTENLSKNDSVIEIEPKTLSKKEKIKIELLDKFSKKLTKPLGPEEYVNILKDCIMLKKNIIIARQYVNQNTKS